MHLEILVEEISAQKLLDNILPKLIIGEHTYRIITYQGKPDMLKKLPKTLKGYSRWMQSEMRIIILIDLDNENCFNLKQRLEGFAMDAQLKTKSTAGLSNHFQVMNRIAVEELEAWLLGDEEAIKSSYPRVSSFSKKQKYRNPDSIIDASETLENILQRHGYFRNGLRKIEASENISKYMQPLKNRSKSFQVFWEGIYHCLQ